MEGEGKPPPYNYGAISTDANYQQPPPPYPAGGKYVSSNSTFSDCEYKRYGHVFYQLQRSRSELKFFSNVRELCKRQYLRWLTFYSRYGNSVIITLLIRFVFSFNLFMEAYVTSFSFSHRLCTYQRVEK